MTRTREDVWTLTRAEGDWPETLIAYEKAVALLRERDPASGPPVEPLGWRFLAAIHGLQGPRGGADTSNALWSNCQHGSWFFLPWHRMYLMAFELAIQDALEDDEWSLPYWYSLDPDDADTAVLPPAFRDDAKQLWTAERSIAANSGAPLPPLQDSVIDALRASPYSTANGVSTFGGGERAEPSFSGDESGLLEDTPHGGVHVLVGNDFDRFGNLVRAGWMGSFFTAGLDPIFWLHHANLDRLWQVWLELDPDNHLNPTGDPAWFDTEFSFPAAGGGLHTWTIGDVVDTAAVGYNYESTAPPSAIAPAVAPAGRGPDIGLGEAIVPEPLPPQVIGATADVSLATAAAVDVAITEPADLGFATAEGGPAGDGRVFLRVEGVTGTAAAPVYEIHLNVPEGSSPADHPELRAGYFSTFGLREASQRDDLHDGTGLTTVFDVTSVRDALAGQGRWDPAKLQVSFSPVAPSVPAGEEVGRAQTPDLRAGQIAVVVT